MPDKSITWLLENYGLQGMGWVLAITFLFLLVWCVRWFLAEQREWRAVSEARSQAYHEVVKQNTETMAEQGVIFKERTREILDYVRHTRARR